MFNVFLSDAAQADLRRNVEWWSENRSSSQAERWYDEILKSIYSLSDNPEKCIIARESTALNIELHNLWFGLGSKQTHRVLFTIDGTTVNVLRVLSTRQDTAALKLTGE